MLVQDKVVLVTGGGRNVGAGIVRSLAGHGATLAINCHQSVDLAHQLAESIVGQGGKADVWPCDIRDPEAVKAMAEDVVRRFGRIDAVVNNVGGGATGSLDELTWDQFIHTLELDVKSVLNTCQAVHPHMKAQGDGCIINIGSEQLNEAFPGIAPNVAGKAANLGLTRCLVPELGPENIRVNTIALGWTRTDRTQGRDTPDSPYIKATPLRRMNEPEYVGDVCAFLISDLGKYISGAYILLNGGRHPPDGLTMSPILHAKAILFDAYGTLIDTGDGSVRATAAILRKSSCLHDPIQFYAAWKRYHRLHIDSLTDFRPEEEIFLLDLVRLYEDYGISGHPEEDVRIMLSTLGVRQAFPETRHVLDAIRATHRLYIASTSDHAPLMSDVERNGIIVDGVFTSESLRVYKPRPEFYASILSALNLRPEEAVFVGDSLVDDVAGPQAAGLRTVWVNRSGANRSSSDPTPDHEIPDLCGLIGEPGYGTHGDVG